MNDIILSAVLNLLALFGAEKKVDKEKALNIVINYLKRYFYVLARQSYIDFYNDLRDFYEEFPLEQSQNAVKKICDNLHGRIPEEDQALMILRFMEFSDMGTKTLDSESPILQAAVDSFGIKDSLYESFVNFVLEKECDEVKLLQLDNDSGLLKTLFIKEYNSLIFSYIGDSPVFMFDAPVDNFFHVWQQSGVLKSKDFSPVYYATVMSLYGYDTSSSLVDLSARDVEFRFVEGSDYGLHNFTSTVRGGELVAIMGGSGVGKSTLMSLLTGSLIPQQGTITLNGHNVAEENTKSVIGFVPQDDLLIEELTVYQNLWYTAKLCFDKMSPEELDKKVISVLEQLELDKVKDLKVGSPINKYISGGQRKRLNIAMELIREPSVIFLDEPTSGLSSSDTEKVVNILKALTYKGKLIISNIHQPSSEVFKLFDRLWILDVGGYPVYDGNPIDAISYFKTAENYADSEISACKSCGTVKPEIPLNIINTKLLDTTGRMTENRKVSPTQWHDKYLEHRKVFSDVDVRPLPVSLQLRPNVFNQMKIFFQRNVKTKLANLQYILVTTLEAPILAVICGLLTKYTPDNSLYSVIDNKNIVTYYFMAVIVSIFLGMAGSAEEIIKDRAILKREKFLNLSYKSYISSKVLFMALISLLQTFLFIVIGNAILGIHGMFFMWWLILFISSFLSSLIGLLLSQCLNSVVAIYISIPLLLIPQILLCGLVVDFDDINSKSETGNVPVIGDIIPSRWAFEALAVANFTMNEYEKPLFPKERIKYSYAYYNNAYLYELRSQLETYKDEINKGKTPNQHHIDVIRSSLPKLIAIAQIDNYSGDFSYDSLNSYFDQIESSIGKKSSKLTMEIDNEISKIIREIGQENYLEIKKNNFNQRLEDLVVNRNAEKMCVVKGTHIVPKSGFIFLTPESTIGRAPFYSGVKCLGKNEVLTPWFNMGVLVIMSIIFSVLLYLDYPGKKVRKERN